MSTDPDQPLVTIAMPARDAAATLPLTLASLRAQTYPNWELLFIDDGSRDRTLAVVRDLDDPRIRVVSDGVGRGTGARRNQAVALARGALLAWQDADDLAYPERIARQVEHMRRHPEIDLLGTGALVIDAQNRPLGLLPQSGPDHDALCAHPELGFALPQPTWMARTDWLRHHPYREDLRRTEDQELLLRTHRHSRFALLPEVLLGYRRYGMYLRKEPLGHLEYARVAWELLDGGTALRTVAVRSAKALAGVLLILAGQGKATVRRRAAPVPPAERERWRAVLAGLGAPLPSGPEQEPTGDL